MATAFKKFTIARLIKPYAQQYVGLGDEENFNAFFNPVETTADLADPTADINTVDKYIGKPAYDSDTGEPVWATGADPGDAWMGTGGGGPSLPVGTVTDASLRWNGAAWVEETELQISSNNGRLNVGGGTAVSPFIEIDVATGGNTLLSFRESGAVRADLQYFDFSNDFDIRTTVAASTITVRPQNTATPSIFSLTQVDLNAGTASLDLNSASASTMQSADGTAGEQLTIFAGDGTAGNGGLLALSGGDGTVTGGNLNLQSGDGGSGNGGDINLRPGAGVSSLGGFVNIQSALAATSAPNLLFSEAAGNGTSFIALRAPAAITTVRFWTLMSDDPAAVAGDFITTDASGNLSFAAGGLTSPVGAADGGTGITAYNTGAILRATGTTSFGTIERGTSPWGKLLQLVAGVPQWEWPLGVRLTEGADHPQTPTAGFGEIWLDNTTDQRLTFTDDQGDDYVLGVVVQTVNVQDGEVATGTTTIPFDDTIPQITEGDEYMTLAITPKNANNLLRIDVVIHLANSTTSNALTAALFQDSTANALAAGQGANAGANFNEPVQFTHWMVAGTVSATTFRVRAGRSGSGTVTFNGQSGVRIFGGVMASTITITEYLA